MLNRNFFIGFFRSFVQLGKEPLKSEANKMQDLPPYQTHRFKEKYAPYCLTAITWNEGERIRAQIERMAFWGDKVDVVIIDGGSNDGSLEFNHLRDHRVTALVTVGASGLGTAIRAAIAFSLAENYQGLITIDGNSIWSFAQEL